MVDWESLTYQVFFCEVMVDMLNTPASVLLCFTFGWDCCVKRMYGSFEGRPISFLVYRCKKEIKLLSRVIWCWLQYDSNIPDSDLEVIKSGSDKPVMILLGTIHAVGVWWHTISQVSDKSDHPIHKATSLSLASVVGDQLKLGIPWHTTNQML